MSQRTWDRIGIVAALLLFAVVLAMPSRADAAETYGPWFAQPGTTPTNNQPAPYANYEPFNNGDVRESTAFTCVLPNGQFLDGEMREYLGDIIDSATKVYNGDYELSANTALLNDSTSEHDVDNAGWDSGASGMRQFLANERRLMDENVWALMDHRQFVKGSAGIPVGQIFSAPSSGEGAQYRPPNAEVNVEIDEDHYISAKYSRQLKELVPSDAAHPVELMKGIPEGCVLQVLEPPEISFSDMFTDPGDFVASVLLYVPAFFASEGYEIIHPYAWQWTFWTPHSERGDTFFNITNTCVPDSSGFSGRDVHNQCEGSKPLGYDERTLDVNDQSAWYLGLARFFTWLISGTYFLIMFTAATLFIIRGNASTTFNVMKLMPRLIASVLLTVFSGFLIGAMITTSNLLVQSVLGFTNDWTIGAINASMTQAEGIAFGTEPVRILIEVLVGVPSVWFMFMLALGSILRQLLLIMLVILAPVAAFTMIVDAWRHHFSRYIRALVAVIFVPVALALVLKVAMMINPLVSMPETVYGKPLGTMGLFMIAATLWALTKVLRTGLGVATNSAAIAGGGMGGAMMGGLAGGVRPDDEAKGLAASLRRLAAGGLDASGSAMNASSAAGAKLIPPDRVMGALTPGGAAAVAAQGGVGGGMLDRGLAKGLGAGQSLNEGAGSKISDWMAKKSVGKTLDQHNALEGMGHRLLGEGEMGNYDALAATVAASAGVTSAQWAQMSFAQKQPYLDKVAGEGNSFGMARDGTAYMRQSEATQQARAQAALGAGAKMANAPAPTQLPAADPNAFGPSPGPTPTAPIPAPSGSAGAPPAGPVPGGGAVPSEGGAVMSDPAHQAPPPVSDRAREEYAEQMRAQNEAAERSAAMQSEQISQQTDHAEKVEHLQKEQLEVQEQQLREASETRMLTEDVREQQVTANQRAAAERRQSRHSS